MHCAAAASKLPLTLDRTILSFEAIYQLAQLILI
jgi:hypothetical protein